MTAVHPLIVFFLASPVQGMMWPSVSQNINNMITTLAPRTASLQNTDIEMRDRRLWHRIRSLNKEKQDFKVKTEIPLGLLF